MTSEGKILNGQTHRCISFLDKQVAHNLTSIFKSSTNGKVKRLEWNQSINSVEALDMIFFFVTEKYRERCVYAIIATYELIWCHKERCANTKMRVVLYTTAKGPVRLRTMDHLGETLKNCYNHFKHHGTIIRKLVLNVNRQNKIWRSIADICFCF